MKNPWKRYSKISPQREDGNTQINKDILEALIKFNLNASDYKIILFIIRKTYGFNKTSDAISISQFQKATNLSNRMINIGIKKLKKHRLIFYQPSSIGVKQGSPINEFLFNKHHDTWLPIRVKRSSGGEILCKRRVKRSSDTKDIITKDIMPNFKFQKKVPLPTNIFLTDKMREYVQNQGGANSGHAEQLFEDFQNHHKAHGKKMNDWTAAFRTWVRNDKKWNPEKYTVKIYE